MSEDTVLQEVQAVFVDKIMQKNSWGKNEILSVWKDSLIEVLTKKIKETK